MSFLGNADPRPMFPPARDSFGVRIMLAVLGQVEANYDRRGDR